MGYVFVSYSHQDAGFVGRMAEQLRKDGIEVWSDRILAPGEKFAQRIEQEVAGCAVFVPVMSTSSKGSDWVERECDLAVTYQRVIMPVGLNGEVFERYHGILCELCSDAGTVSERFRQALREVCRPSVRFVHKSAMIGHTHAVRSIAFAADGGLLASADDRTVRLWDMRSGVSRLVLSGGIDPTWPVAFAGDGRIASAAVGQSGVHLWNPATGALARSLGTHERVRSIAFSANGSWLATGGDDQSARVWSIADGRQVARLSAASMVPAWPVSFSPDGTRLAVANFGSHSVSVWNTASWRLEIRTGVRPSRASALCWNPEATIVISGGQGGDICVDGVTGEVLRQLDLRSGAINAVACSPNGRVFATAGTDGIVRIVGLVTGEEVQSLANHDGPVYAVAFSPDGSCLVSAGADKLIRVWRTK